MTLKLMSYTGSKLKFVPTFKSIEHAFTDRSVYIEPFIGGGSVYANTRVFDSYVVNDANAHIVSIYEAFREATYADLTETLAYVTKKFGCIKTNKESYYAYRNWYNDTYHFSDDETKGLWLYFIVNATINGFARFGPNGFNNSFGKRLYVLDEDVFDTVKKKLQKSTITAKDYKECLVDDKDTVMFLDPPYMDAKSSYTSHFGEKELVEFLETIRDLKHTKVVYTDILNQHNADILSTWNMRFIRDMKNTSPNRKTDVTGKQEVFFQNF